MPSGSLRTVCNLCTFFLASTRTHCHIPVMSKLPAPKIVANLWMPRIPTHKSHDVYYVRMLNLTYEIANAETMMILRLNWISRTMWTVEHVCNDTYSVLASVKCWRAARHSGGWFYRLNAATKSVWCKCSGRRTHVEEKVFDEENSLLPRSFATPA